jgi:hypothetical protein
MGSEHRLKIRHAAERMGSVVAIEGPAESCWRGVCFHQMHARALVEANGWRPLMTDSAKRVNVMADVPGETAGTRVATALTAASASPRETE